MSLCRSCGKENKDGERSCCYCFAPLEIDVDALFLAVQKGQVDASSLMSIHKEITFAEQRSESEEAESEELLLLDDGMLLPVHPRQDYRRLHSLCEKLSNDLDIAVQRQLLRSISSTALRISRGLGRVEPMKWGAKPLVLFVQGVEDEDVCTEMMELFDIPLFRARYFCSGRILDVVLHGEERVVMEALAVQYRMRFSAQACVVSLAQLRDYPPPMACLGMLGERFRIVDAPLWRVEKEDGLEESILARARIAVLGMVEEVRYRRGQYTEVRSFGRRKKETVRKKSTEKKIGVIDLHCDDVVVRIAEGVTDFSTLPGFEKGAQRKSFQQLCGLLSVWIPHIEVVDPKVMRVHTTNELDMVEHAWDSWESYSYSVRQLFCKKLSGD